MVTSYCCVQLKGNKMKDSTKRWLVYGGLTAAALGSAVKFASDYMDASGYTLRLSDSGPLTEFTQDSRRHTDPSSLDTIKLG